MPTLDKYKKNYNISVIILFNKKNCKTSQVCDLTCTNLKKYFHNIREPFPSVSSPLYIYCALFVYRL